MPVPMLKMPPACPIAASTAATTSPDVDEVAGLLAVAEDRDALAAAKPVEEDRDDARLAFGSCRGP